MKIHHYDPDTRFLIGEGVADAVLHVPGEWLIPAHATDAVPPEITDPDRVARFDPQSGGWEVAERPAPQQPSEEPKMLGTLEQEIVAAEQRVDLFAAPFIAPAHLATEYMMAAAAARAWLSDTSAAPPLRVVALAKAKDLTNRNAAKHVLDRWDQAALVADAVGAARITAKASIREAEDFDELEEAERAGKEAVALASSGRPA